MKLQIRVDVVPEDGEQALSPSNAEQGTIFSELSQASKRIASHLGLPPDTKPEIQLRFEPSTIAPKPPT